MNVPESFGDDKSLDPFTEKRVADKVRSALTDHADRVEPAANSYLTLSSRLAGEISSTPKARGRVSARILAAAAMVVVVAGAGIYALNQSGGSDFEATGGVANSTAPSSAPPVPTTAVMPTSMPGEVTTTVAPAPPEPMVEVLESAQLPSAGSVSEASRSLVHLLGLPGQTRIEERDSIGILLPPAELDYGGSVPELAKITTRTDSNGTAAVSATSETMQIESVRLDGEEIVVTGKGSAFEAWVGVQLISTDGTRLASTFTMAGCCEELVPFEARLPLVPGVGEAFVIVHGDNAGSGVVPAFAAVPIHYRGSVDDSTTYTVFRIRPNDSDRGLNIRDLPGTDEGEVLATLPSGTSGIQRLPRMPALVGDSFWWRVRTADDIDGWVHSSFLTPDQPALNETELRHLAESAIFGISAAEFDGLSGVSFSRRVPVAVGWIGDPTFVVGPDLVDPAFWTEARLWRVPEATFGEPETTISLRSLMNLPDLTNQGPALQSGAALPYGFEQNMAENYFAGTQAVTVVGPEDGEPLRSMVLFFESSPTGPQLVGVVASIFVP